MKPYPFASLNHFTVPCAIRPFPLMRRRRSDGWRVDPRLPRSRPPWPGCSSGGRPAPMRPGRRRTKKDAARSRSRDVVFRQPRATPVVARAATQRGFKVGATLQRRKKECQDGSRSGSVKSGEQPGLAGTGEPGGAEGVSLHFPDVGRLQALGASRHLELDLIALAEALEALSLDGAVMDEDVLAALLGDEAESLRIVEPLHSSLCHARNLSSGSSAPGVLPPAWRG